MPRLSTLQDILFPVSAHPVFTTIVDEGSTLRLPVPYKKAIVHRTSRRVLGVVSDDYRLVSNEEALEMAQQCCRSVFPETKPGEWEVKTIDAPSTASYCQIDLVHNSTALDFDIVSAGDRPEVFGPFIRVTNSFNGLRALSFYIGYYRKVCKNGLIIPETIIHFSFPHLRRDIGLTIQFKIAHERLARFKTAFNDLIGGLRNCPVPRSEFEPLIHSALLISPPQHVEPETDVANQWLALEEHLAELSSRYVKELGENAYAVFNVITELASHPPVNRYLRRDRHSLQCLAGSWLTAFNNACQKPDFSLAGYLANQQANIPAKPTRKDART